MRLLIFSAMGLFFSILLFFCVSKDKIITEGSAYGFSIGMTKKQVFEVAKSRYKNKKVYMLGLIDSQGNENPFHSLLAFSDEHYLQIEQRNIWELYLEENFLSMMRLTFSDKKLVSIYKQKKLSNFLKLDQ